MKNILITLIFMITALKAQTPSHTNSLGMKFVPVKDTQVYFCVHETRRQDYELFDKEIPQTKLWWKFLNNIEGKPVGDQPNHPITGIDYDEAVAFCNWLSAKEGKTYRLPTDKEWSYAVGIGNSEKWLKSSTPESMNLGVSWYPWESKKLPPASGNYGDVSWVKAFPGNPYIEKHDDGFVTTAPAMSFKPNKFGLYDMGGNVSEWVSDWFNTEKIQHTLRGGGYHSAGKFLYSAARITPDESGTRYYRSYGFRVVLEIPKK